MRRLVPIFFILLILMVVGTSLASARAAQATHPDLVVGAQIYDRWFAALGVPAPIGNFPVWSRQSSNTRSGPDTWRCSECHGWDYKGSSGEYAIGSHKTGFPGLLGIVSGLTEQDIAAQLKGSKDPQHNFSKYLDDASIQKIALFLRQGMIDDSQYIDSVSLKVKDGNLQHGKQFFDATCAQCHGADGTKKIFRTEGVDESLSDVANRDPFRFLHRTRFGFAGTDMAVGYELGWTPADGRDVLAYAQTLPRAQTGPEPGPAGANATPAPSTLGGPSNNPIAGIFVGIIAALGTIGSSILFLTILVFIGFAVVFILRRRK